MLLIYHQPLPTRKARFDHPDWIFELKYDGFRALACIENRRCRFISRNGHRFSSFSNLERAIETAIAGKTILDGELVCVDDEGRPQFEDLLLRRGNPCFFVFDLLMREGQDFRSAALMDRKQELRRLLATVPPDVPVRYVDRIEGKGIALFERVCVSDLEGIVAKLKPAPYGTSREESTWPKIDYFQMQGREELFERNRHQEPVPGWHTCELACEELQAYAA
jgi:bifunctional non-homologous end joining protein LigD